ncbi:PGN_0703 family putative restriction endonuclease [Mesorhizobium sp. IMUNJ 23232]|uniref:PGN_0703 family putative restriction endonuclease n=1 Tax=Mesorhizobium sp. IMUNJ 23232 TaxID=3376064 RepID=UPI0037A00C66
MMDTGESILPHLDRSRIRDFYEKADGRELEVKFHSPESSAALAANALGLFLDDARPLVTALGLRIDGPAKLKLEQCLRFPWSGGRHPWLDAVIETPDSLIAIESKRYEPFRGSKNGAFSTAYLKPVWGEGMARFLAQRDAIMDGSSEYDFLDTTQLVKHAFGLATQSRKQGRRPFLVYLHAEPDRWPNGSRVSAERILAHRAERDRFEAAVKGDFVAFHVMDYRGLLYNLSNSGDAYVQRHVDLVIDRFAPL